MCSIYRGVCLLGMAGQVAPMFSLTRVDAIPVLRVGEPCKPRRAVAPWGVDSGMGLRRPFRQAGEDKVVARS
jgi:hypothetical protein